MQACVDAVFDDEEVRSALRRVLDRVTGPGWSNALSAKLLDLAVPGVPDLYQGSELWQLSLVDPDNRRPVDFGIRAELLAQVRSGDRPVLTGGLDDTGVVKLLLSHQALTLRRDHPELFGGWRLVVCSANHDQVGNRARGDRLAERLDADQLACAALVTLTTPFTPMVFQGEEWGTLTPFPFFASHPEADLAESVSAGRLAEFARMAWDTDVVPDPQDPATFASAKLRWAEVETGSHTVVLQAYRELIELRRQYAELTNPVLARTRCEVDEEARWFLMRRGGLVVAVNFSAARVTLELGGRHQLRWSTPSGARMSGTQVLSLIHI